MSTAVTETYITTEVIASFRSHLISEEKSEFTIDKYIRDVTEFAEFLGGEPLSKEKTFAYKSHLMDCGKFADSSINSMISSIRALLKFVGRQDCAVLNLRIQEMPFNPEEKNLTQDEFERLLEAAKGDRRLHLLLKVMFCTGIRVSEVKYFTVESFKGKLDKVRVTVRCKKKNRRVIVADEIRREVMGIYKRKQNRNGVDFSHKKRQAARQMRHLEADETPVRESESCAEQGVPAQPPQTFRANVLRGDARYRSACGSARSQQHKHDEDLR